MNNTPHTPTPWARLRSFSIEAPDGRTLADVYGPSDEEREANAAFITLAANSHDALVEALERVKGYIPTDQFTGQALRGQVNELLTKIGKEKGE